MSEPENIVVRVATLPPPGPIGADVYAYRAEPLVPLQPGEIRVETLFASVDAGARAMIDPHASYPMKLRPGNRVPTSAIVGRVVESRNPAFGDGDHVRAFLVTRQQFLVLDPARHLGVKRVDPADGPLHLHLGTIGMTGFTAWLGITGIGRPRAGETVLVSAAAGAVGSVAGQIAKATGARVIGIAGGADKCRTVVERFGFDDCVDYKSPTFVAALAQACPDGVDVYFENVGGSVQRAAFASMNVFGRVVLCGQIAGYGGGDSAEATGVDLMVAINQRLTLRGYLSSDHLADLPRFEADMLQRVKAGALIPGATITAGFTNLHLAVNSLTSGRNIGQQIHQMTPP